MSKLSSHWPGWREDCEYAAISLVVLMVVGAPVFQTRMLRFLVPWSALCPVFILLAWIGAFHLKFHSLEPTEKGKRAYPWRQILLNIAWAEGMCLVILLAALHAGISSW